MSVHTHTQHAHACTHTHNTHVVPVVTVWSTCLLQMEESRKEKMNRKDYWLMKVNGCSSCSHSNHVKFVIM